MSFSICHAYLRLRLSESKNSERGKGKCRLFIVYLGGGASQHFPNISYILDCCATEKIAGPNMR